MAPVLRIMAYVTMLLILVCWIACIWSLRTYVTSTDPLRGEILMVLPGTSLYAAMSGLILWLIRHFARKTFRRRERAMLAVFGILGPLLLVVVIVYDVVW